MLSWQQQTPVQRSAALLLLTALGAALLLGGAYWYRDSSFKRQKQAQQSLQYIEYETSLAKERYALLVEHQDTFLRLVAGGIVGDEHRLSWIEALKYGARYFRIPKIKYRINARALDNIDSFAFNAEADEPPKLFRSRMELEMSLLHEGEILSLLDTLHSNAEGAFTVDQCTVSRSAEQLVWDLSANFRALCFLDWYTIARPKPATDA